MKRLSVEEAAQPLIAHLAALQEPARVIRLLGRRVLDRPVDRIKDRHEDRQRGQLLVHYPIRHERQPFEDQRASVEVVRHHIVRYAVIVHDFDAAQLSIRRVHLPAEDLVERAGAG